MSADHLNPDVRNTAATYVCKALLKVNPVQRPELMRAMIEQAEDYLNRVEPRSFRDPDRKSPGR